MVGPPFQAVNFYCGQRQTRTDSIRLRNATAIGKHVPRRCVRGWCPPPAVLKSACMKTRLASAADRRPATGIARSALAIGIAVLAAGCRERESPPPPAFPTNAVAVVDGQAIPGETFQAELVRRAQAAPGNFNATAEKQAVLEELIRFEVLHQKALAAGYDQDPQITANLKRMIVAKFQQDQLAKAEVPPVTPDELAAFYQNNAARFGTPERVRAALIELKAPRTASAAKRAEIAARSEAVRAEAQTNAASDHTFGLVAQRHSEHQPSRYRGGDVGWLTVGATNTEWPPAVMAALDALAQPGDTSPVIETPTAFYLVRLVERQPATMRPLEEVKDGVAYLVARQKEQERQEALHAALRKGMNIRINQALLESITVPRPETRPPGVPGGPKRNDQ